MISEAEILAYNKTTVWVRLPKPNKKAHIVLTLPRAALKHGMARAKVVEVEWDPETVESDSMDTAEFSGYRAEMEMLRVIEYQGDPTGS